MKKLLLLLLLLLSISFAVVQLSAKNGTTFGVSDVDIGIAYFNVNPISYGYDYQKEPQEVDNPWWTITSDYSRFSSIGVRVDSNKTVDITIKMASAYVDSFPNDGVDYLIGYNFVYPKSVSNIDEDIVIVKANSQEPFGWRKNTPQYVGSIHNKSSGSRDYYITIQWFFNLYKNKKINSGIYDSFINPIEVEVVEKL